ncbi:MAG: lipoate--protein ligase family protein [Planctomycetota bacterium]|jgi:lipoate-protein ligase A
MNAGLPFRLINDRPLDGPTNMARDEALMLAVGEGDSPPTLRLYEWSPPTISLGYFQRFDDVSPLAGDARELAVVRRLTGGGAILHDRELTYSLVLPIDHALILRRPNHLYELAHDAIIEVLGGMGIAAARDGETDDSGAARGPFYCFARRHALDVLIGQEKIAGSAQRRTQKALLQHGSIVLSRRYQSQPAAEIDMEYGRSIDILRTRFPEVLSSHIPCTVKESVWTEHEMGIAASLIEKYAGEEWTRRT